MIRKSGEVWISKESPHTLKYYAGSTEYWTVEAITYEAGETLVKGQVVMLDPTSTSQKGRIKRATWPMGMKDVVGIALNSANFGEDIRVLDYGYMEFSREELEALFVTKSDITVGSMLSSGNYYTAFGDMSDDGGGGNSWSTDSGTWSGKGAPIYWNPGRVLKTSGGYEFQQPVPGSLTIATPAGYKYPNPTLEGWNDDVFNVNYKYLPSMGNIKEYTHDGVNVTSMIIHINFPKFYRKIQFEYPANGLFHFDALAETDEKVIEIRHGLFNNAALFFVDLSILGSEDSELDGEIVRIWPGYENNKSENRTSVTIKSDSDFYGKIVGTVGYTL